MTQAPQTDPLRATDAWFLRNGLSYFVPERRADVRRALRPRRLAPFVAVTVLVAAAAGTGLALLTGSGSLAPAALLTVGIVAALGYGLTALNARPIVTWALSQTFGSLRVLLPMMSRALPLLLLFITFLFINAEVWQVTSRQDSGELWLVVLLFSVLAVAFLLVRLPEEVDRTDDHVDDAFLLDACRGTPLEESSRELVEDPESDPASYAQVTGYEFGNLVMVLVIIQVVQVLLLAVTVFLFFLVFGGLVMTTDVVEAWIGEPSHNWKYLPNLTVELVQVSIFLAAFSGLYLTVSTVTDETYREQFFSRVQRQMERAVGVRAVYLALRDRDGSLERASDPAPS